MNRIPALLIAAAALAGLLLSAALILEFHGITLAATETVCRSGASGFNACQNVARSPSAAISGVPLIGALPTALFGFLLYGFILVLSFRMCIVTPKGRHGEMAVIALLSTLALFFDVYLLYVMAYVIRAICALCLMTYVANALIAAASIASLILYLTEPPMTFLACIIKFAYSAIRAQLPFYSAIAVLILAAGFAVGTSAQTALARSISQFSSNEQIQKFIAEYEATPESDIDNTQAHLVGPTRAPVAVTVFTDYTCDHCATATKRLAGILSSFPGKVSVAYRTYPLGGECDKIASIEKSTDGSCIGAMAAHCAHQLGKFKEMHERLYRDSDRGVFHSARSVGVIAASIGIPSSAFDACMKSPATGKSVQREARRGDALKIDGTPTIFINKRRVGSGLPSEASLRGLVEYLIARGK